MSLLRIKGFPEVVSQIASEINQTSKQNYAKISDRYLSPSKMNAFIMQVIFFPNSAFFLLLQDK